MHLHLLQKLAQILRLLSAKIRDSFNFEALWIVDEMRYEQDLTIEDMVDIVENG
jgi:hypothetical protein